MDTSKEVKVQMVLTPAPELLPVLQGFVDRLAEMMSFAECQRFNLKQGLRHACRRMMEGEAAAEEEIRLELSGFPGRLEIALETTAQAAQMTEADSFLLNQLLDRVVFEEIGEGHARITLVKYHSQQGANHES